MTLLHEFLETAAMRTPQATALRRSAAQLSYESLATAVSAFAGGIYHAGLERMERVAIYLPKSFENVIAMFGTAAAGGAFVPLNPLLKSEQVAYILRDCGVRILVTESQRAEQLADVLDQCPDLHTVVLTDGGDAKQLHKRTVSWEQLQSSGGHPRPRTIDADITSIFYTSGSTGKPKGVVLSHRNMVAGAQSVAHYLKNTPDDRLLAALPLSFDYGFSQLSTAFSAGASVTLLDYLLPRDIVRAIVRDEVTGLAGVPPLWIQLANIDWPEGASRSLRYITNSGGAMPRATLETLQAKFGEVDVYLMYGLTEAFRSTYLPPEQVAIRPDSMGKAIPNAEVVVVREDGTRCEPDEPGELVHRGALVSLGYWNDSERTAARFKPFEASAGLMLPEIAVWSGDQVRADSEGYLYFIGRKDDMIKTSGYRVSPTEIEEVVYESGLVAEVAAVGIAHPTLGQAVVLVLAQPKTEQSPDEAILAACRQRLPNYMVPSKMIWRDALPRNPNGKIHRTALASELKDLFKEP